jgi:hypothetical protein
MDRLSSSFIRKEVRMQKYCTLIQIMYVTDA